MKACVPDLLAGQVATRKNRNPPRPAGGREDMHGVQVYVKEGNVLF